MSRNEKGSTSHGVIDLDNLESEMVIDTIKELANADNKISTLLVIADTEDVQMVKLGANWCSRQDLQSLLGTLEIMKSRIVTTLEKDRETDDVDGNDKDKGHFGFH